MAEVQKGSPQREVIENRPNEVLSVAEARVMMFRFTDANGYVDIGLALCFGQDKEDNGLGVYVVAPTDLKNALKVPHPYVKSGVRKFLEASEKEAELGDGGELPSLDGDEG